MTDTAVHETSETLKEERDRFNSQVKELILKSKEITLKINELHELVDPFKEKGASFDKFAVALQSNLKNIKSEKKSLVKKVSSVSSNLKKMYKGESFDPSALIKEIKKLDWIVQTEVLSGKKEDELSRKVISLEKRLRESEHYMGVKSEIDSLQDKIDHLRYLSEMHADVINDILDKKFKAQSESFKVMRALKKEHLKFRKTNVAIKEAKKQADIYHGKLVVLINGRKKEKKLLDKKRNEQKQERQKQMLKDKTEVKKKESLAIEKSHDDMFSQLKKKGKITL